MRLSRIAMKDYRGFRDLDIDLCDDLTVLVGVNGAGKSSVLEAIATMLSWCIERIRNENGTGWCLKDTDILNGANAASLTCTGTFADSDFQWSYSHSRSGTTNGIRSDWTSLARFTEQIRNEITQTNGQCSVPVYIYYGVDRVVNEINVDTPRNQDVFNLLSAYESSLSGATNFQAFFEWYRAREDLENEDRVYHRRSLPGGEIDIPIGRLDPHLKAVRSAFRSLPMNLREMYIRRRELAMVALKGDREIRLDQLSDGEKCLITMVGDIARRLAIANPVLEDPLQGNGIVLIDEIELHLHPAWQRSVIGNLRRVFPNLQFIITTHSPQVLGEVPHENIRCLYVDDEKGQQAYTPARSLGLDSNSLLEEVFHASPRNLDTAEKLRAIFDQIARDDFDTARRSVEELEGELGGDIPELLKARTMIAMLEGSGAEY